MKTIAILGIAAIAALTFLTGCAGNGMAGTVPANPFLGDRFDGDILLPTRGGGPSIQLENMKILASGTDNKIGIISGVAKENQGSGTVVTGTLSGTITADGDLALKVDFSQPITWTYAGTVEWTDGRGGPSRWVEGEVQAITQIKNQGSSVFANGGDPAPKARIMWWAHY